MNNSLNKRVQQKDATKSAASTQRPTLGRFKCVCAVFCALPRVLSTHCLEAFVGSRTPASWLGDHSALPQLSSLPSLSVVTLLTEPQGMAAVGTLQVSVFTTVWPSAAPWANLALAGPSLPPSLPPFDKGKLGTVAPPTAPPNFPSPT